MGLDKVFGIYSPSNIPPALKQNKDFQAMVTRFTHPESQGQLPPEVAACWAAEAVYPAGVRDELLNRARDLFGLDDYQKYAFMRDLRRVAYEVLRYEQSSRTPQARHGLTMLRELENAFGYRPKPGNIPGLSAGDTGEEVAAQLLIDLVHAEYRLNDGPVNRIKRWLV